MDLLFDRLDLLIETVHQSKPQQEGEGILVPGEREGRLAEAQRRNGISLPIEARQSISRAAGRLGLAVPDGCQLEGETRTPGAAGA